MARCGEGGLHPWLGRRRAGAWPNGLPGWMPGLHESTGSIDGAVVALQTGPTGLCPPPPRHHGPPARRLAPHHLPRHVPGQPQDEPAFAAPCDPSLRPPGHKVAVSGAYYQCLQPAEHTRVHLVTGAKPPNKMNKTCLQNWASKQAAKLTRVKLFSSKRRLRCSYFV